MLHVTPDSLRDVNACFKLFLIVMPAPPNEIGSAIARVVVLGDSQDKPSDEAPMRAHAPTAPAGRWVTGHFQSKARHQ